MTKQYHQLSQKQAEEVDKIWEEIAKGYDKLEEITGGKRLKDIAWDDFEETLLYQSEEE